MARYPAEIGRIEFKACDSCADFSIYAALLTLLKGLALDDTLRGRATIPDGALHQLSARMGFNHPNILMGARAILLAVALALSTDSDIRFLEPLYSLLQRRATSAHQLIQIFRETNSMRSALCAVYTDADAQQR